MYKSLSFVKDFWAKSFWTSKLGQAAFASIVAMSAMVVVTTQFDASEAQAAAMTQPHAIGVVSVEIA